MPIANIFLYRVCLERESSVFSFSNFQTLFSFVVQEMSKGRKFIFLLDSTTE